MGLVGVIDIYIENTGCGADGGSSWAVEMIVFSMVAGLAGSLVCHPPTAYSPSLTIARFPTRSNDATNPLLLDGQKDLDR